MADVDRTLSVVMSNHFLSRCTQVGATSNDVMSSPAKTVYIATNMTTVATQFGGYVYYLGGR